MKKIITMLFAVTLLLVANFIYAQETSVGPAPLSSAYIPYSTSPSDYVGSRAFVYDGAGYPTFQLAKHSLGTCNLTPVGSGVSFSVFPGASTVNTATNVLYVCEQGGAPWNIWSVDTTTGVRTVACTMNGISFSNVTGITWDPAHSIMYGMNSSLSTSQLFSINMSTGLCTNIGTASSTCPGAISVSSSATGTLFCVDLVNNNLYKVNRTTGVFTLVGAMGYDSNYGQDAQFDMNPAQGGGDNKLYWASCGGAVQLRIIDTTTGSSTAVCTYSSIQIATIGIFGKFVGINKDNSVSEVNVYPNPANNVLNITAQNIETLKVLNIAGQVIDNQVVNNNNAEINVSNYSAGIYFVQVRTDKGFFTKKFTGTK